MIQTTRPKPEDLARAASASTHTETFDPKDILEVQDLLEFEKHGSATITNNIYLGTERRSPSFGSRNLDRDVITGQNPQGLDSRNYFLAREL